MIDSHCHLDREPLISNLNEVLTRAKDVGLEKLLTICTTSSGYNDILNIVSKDQMIYGTFGIHPHETKNYFIEKDEIVKKVGMNSKIIGVGETGLDFYHSIEFKKKQYGDLGKERKRSHLRSKKRGYYVQQTIHSYTQGDKPSQTAKERKKDL